MSAPDNSSVARLDEQATKKRKVEVIEILDSDDEDGSSAKPATALESSSSTGFTSGGVQSITSTLNSRVSQEGKKRTIAEVLEGASAEEGRSILRTLLKRHDDQINGLQKTRHAVAMRLKKEGDRVIVNPWDRNRLQDRIEELILEIDPSDRVHPDEEEKAEAIRRMELALKNGYQCDGDGYITGSGKYVWFDPNEGESEDEP